MKYMLTIFESFGITNYSISTTSDGVEFVSFPAVKGNPNYDAFLVDAQLTGTEVHELTPDIWYDFPEGEIN